MLQEERWTSFLGLRAGSTTRRSSYGQSCGNALFAGDVAGANELQEETLDLLRRVLERESSAWNLFRTLRGLGEHVSRAGRFKNLKRDLLWLLDRDLASLERTIREYTAEKIKKEWLVSGGNTEVIREFPAPAL